MEHNGPRLSHQLNRPGLRHVKLVDTVIDSLNTTLLEVLDTTTL